MAKRQQSRSMTKEASGTRGRSNPKKTSSKSSNNRRSAARVADNPDEQMQSAMPSDSTGGRNGRSRAGKQRSGVRSKKNASKAKSTAPKRTRAAR
jgi:hypothetical protein